MKDEPTAVEVEEEDAVAWVQLRCVACGKRLADYLDGNRPPRVVCPRCGRHSG